MKKVLKRILTALIGIPIVAGAIVQGGALFALLAMILSMGAWIELKKMLEKNEIKLLPVGLGANMIVLFVTWQFGLQGLAAGITVTFLSLFVATLSLHKDPAWFEKINYTFWGFFYTGVLPAHFILLREFLPNFILTTGYGNYTFGELVLWLVLLGTWASDTFAYFFGITLGKHKMCPTISPKKSWEGAVAGFIGCLATIVYLGNNFLQMQYQLLIAIGLIVAFFAPIGDLLESVLKRKLQVKDSGNFFPGHGGILDRLDSLIIVLPLIYYLVLLA